ncbi:hypothetical protein [Chondromyces crocatus]|uniref:hypothetical protein n=1 Tax=Chondromyces crocatus TaxID=52 RepID=UPI0012E21F7B|nr:hypothetical protein [Chondromyces crocatus]
MKVLPLRMSAADVAALDETWKRLGLKRRTAMIRKAVASLVGEAARTTAAR